MRKCINKQGLGSIEGYCPFALNKRQLFIPVFGVLIAVFALLFGRTGVQEHGFTLHQYHNADAKFLGDHIVTSVDEGIQILDLEGNVVEHFPELSASWMYAQEDVYAKQNVVVYSNHANETHILTLSEENEFRKDSVALRTETLAIDPILIRLGNDNDWLLAHTLIDGTINNPDPEGDNGIYTVKLYRSGNLKEWEYVADIISQKHNTEDGDLRYVDGVLYYFFEMEEYDRGPSKICVMMSEDEGKTWSEPKLLTDVSADNEMASVERTETGWRLYMSSDMASPGASYMGANVYYRDFSADFSTTGEYIRSAMPDNEAVRLYEVKEINGQLHFLFARNYLTDCDLLLRKIEKED